MATITKALSAKVDKAGFSEVLLRVSFGSHGTIRVKSNIFVPVKNWNDKKKEITKAKAIGNAEHSFLDGLTARINRATELIGAVFRAYKEEDVTRELIGNVLIKCTDEQPSTLTRERIEEMLHADEVKKLSIYELAGLYLNNKKFSVSYQKGFNVLVRDLARFEAFTKATEDSTFEIDIDTISTDTICDFFDYLTDEYQLAKEQPKLFKRLLADYPLEISMKHKSPKLVERGDNTIIKLKKKFKAFFIWLNENGYTHNRPFEGIRFNAERYGTPYYLSIEERDQIAGFDLSDKPHLAIQRDIFVFHCMVGCRVGDLLKLTEANNITGDELHYAPHKTKDETSAKEVNVPLTTTAKQLIDHYRGIDEQGRLFPFISAQKYNDAIKKIVKECGITRMVPIRNPKTGENEMKPISDVSSSHMARRTFGGTTYERTKDPSIVCAMTGHVEGSKAFSRYRQINTNILRETIDKIDTAKNTEEQDKADLLSQLSALSAKQLRALLGR